eukprot:10540754-Ditylum_brightwellii.AAC.1
MDGTRPSARRMAHTTSTLQLVDILSGMTDRKFSTTKTGKDRTDYILMSPELAQAVQKKGYQPMDQA